MQGFNAMLQCQGKQPNTVVAAVDPETMELLDHIVLPQQVGGRNPLTVHNGKVYTYMTGNDNVMRVEWDAETQQLRFDKSWFPTYKTKGQTPGAAPCIMGDWVVLNTNASPAQVSMSVVAINQGNADDVHRIEAIPISDASSSFLPAKMGCDVDNNMVYEADAGVGQIAGIRINPDTGDMTKAWGPVDQRTMGFTTPYGPKDQRVLLGSDMQIDDPLAAFGAGTGVYGEQFVWRNAATGEELARSDSFDAMTQGNLPTPGYGGLMYMLQEYGGVVAMQVVTESN
jgi:hypothetical protein